jgi:hypothetical protein
MIRRKLLVALPALVACSVLARSASFANVGPQTRFVWHLPGDRLGVAKEYIGDQLNPQVDESSEDSTRGLPLILIISAIALLPQLAEAVVRVYRGYEYGGVLITSQADELQVKTDRRLPPGMVVVKSENGVTVYQSTSPSADALLSPLKDILEKKK